MNYDTFWSEIGSGVGKLGGTLPPIIPGSPPRGTRTLNKFHLSCLPVTYRGKIYHANRNFSFKEIYDQ